MITRKPTSSPRVNGGKQNPAEAVVERAKQECDFSDRLYDILLEFQRNGEILRKIKSATAGTIGELNMTHSQLYNAIWDAALNVATAGQKNKTSTRVNQSRRETEQHDVLEHNTLSIDAG